MTCPLRAAIAAALLFAPSVGWAQLGLWPECPEGVFDFVSQGILRTAIVRTAPRAYFRRDRGAGKCPNEGASCRSGRYLVPGDTVVVQPLTGRYLCAMYPSARGGDQGGWLLAADVALGPEPSPDSLPRRAAWVGTWKTGNAVANANLDITLAPAGLRVSGDALRSVGPPDLPAAHDGEVAGVARRRGSSYSLTNAGCVVDMELVKPYLVVRDNLRCGGMGVSFTGVYRRASPTATTRDHHPD